MPNYKTNITWQVSYELAKSVFRLTSSFPKAEMYGIAQQMRRAAVSIPSNIAEGLNRTTVAARRQYIQIAYGSAQELESQLHQASVCKLITDHEYAKIKDTLLNVLRLLNCYYKNPCKKQTK